MGDSEPGLEEIVQNATKEELGQFITNLEKEIALVQHLNSKLLGKLTEFPFQIKMQASGKIYDFTGDHKMHAWEIMVFVGNTEEIPAPYITMLLGDKLLDPDKTLMEQHVTTGSIVEVVVKSEDS